MVSLPFFATAAERAAMKPMSSLKDPAQALCWAWVQRELAPELAQQIAAEVARAALPRHGLRLALLRLELGLNQGRLDAALQEAPALLAAFSQAGDDAGQADCSHLLARLNERAGNAEATGDAFQQALAAAKRLDDPRRHMHFEADRLRLTLARDRQLASAEAFAALPAQIELVAALSSDQAAAVADAWAMHFGSGGEQALAIPWLRLALQASVDAGQVRRALTVSSNLGYFLGQIAQYSEALQALQQGLALARSSGAAAMEGGLLINLAELQRQLRQPEAARENLDLAFAAMRQLPSSRNQCTALLTLGRLELDAGQAEPALAAFDAMQQQAGSRNDLLGLARLGRARALAALQRHDEALLQLELLSANSHAQALLGTELEAMSLRAALLQQRADPGALAAAEEVLRRASELPNHQPDPKLFELAAQLLAEQGQFQRAYALLCKAQKARAQAFDAEGARAMAGLRARHQLERAERDNEHLREQSNQLQQQLELLDQLAAVGSELATALEPSAIDEAVELRLLQLLDPFMSALARSDEAQAQLLTQRAQRDGLPLAVAPVSLSELTDPRALAWHKQLPQRVTDSDGRLQALHLPLMLKSRCWGLLSVWPRPDGPAWRDREELVLRVVGLFAVIALANADNYQRLSQLQGHLLRRERQAALGGLVAGVAHELNTPIGNALLSASSLAPALREVMGQLQAGEPLRRSQLQQRIGMQLDGLRLIETSLSTAASLVRSFKQLAGEHSESQRAQFDLLNLAQACATSLGPALREARVALDLHIDSSWQMDSYPEVLGQVLLALIDNARLHAFDGQVDARITVRAQAGQPGRVLLTVVDNGRGMSEADRQRAFEPFFTTRFGQGGSGLGLSIVLNLVEGVLGGQVTLDSAPQLGTRLRLELPLHTP